MCLEIWKLMKFILGPLIWLILVAPHLIAAETDKSLESAAHFQSVAASNIAPMSSQDSSQVHRDVKEKND